MCVCGCVCMIFSPYPNETIRVLIYYKDLHKDKSFRVKSLKVIVVVGFCFLFDKIEYVSYTTYTHTHNA